MNEEEVLQAHEQRLQTLENDFKSLAKDFGSYKEAVDKRLDVIEKEQINVQARLGKLTDKVEKLASSLTTALDKVKKAIILIGLVSVVGIIITIVQDTATKAEIIGAITNITGAVLH